MEALKEVVMIFRAPAEIPHSSDPYGDGFDNNSTFEDIAELLLVLWYGIVLILRWPTTPAWKNDASYVMHRLSPEVANRFMLLCLCGVVAQVVIGALFLGPLWAGFSLQLLKVTAVIAFITLTIVRIRFWATYETSWWS